MCKICLISFNWTKLRYTVQILSSDETLLIQITWFRIKIAKKKNVEERDVRENGEPRPTKQYKPYSGSRAERENTIASELERSSKLALSNCLFVFGETPRWTYLRKSIISIVITKSNIPLSSSSTCLRCSCTFGIEYLQKSTCLLAHRVLLALSWNVDACYYVNELFLFYQTNYEKWAMYCLKENMPHRIH